MKDKDYYYEKILPLLKNSIKEFVSIFDDDDGIYPILGDFGRFIIANIGNKIITEKCFTFINEAFEKGGSDTIKIFSVEIFEQLYENNQLITFARSNLKNKSLLIFEEYLKDYKQKHV